MLSGEGNAGERWKTTISLISKKATLRVQQAQFFVHFFAVVLNCTTTTWNFQKLLSYTFYGGNVARFLVHFFFFTAARFHLALVAASISHFFTAATKFSCCSSNKKCLLCFLSLTLSPFFWLSFAGMPPTFSFSQSFFCSIFQICGNDN